MEQKKNTAKSTTILYKLEYPIQYAGEEIKHIEISRPKGKHVKKLKSGATLEDVMKVASHCSGQPPSVLESMDAYDYVKISEIIGDFLDNGRAIG